MYIIDLIDHDLCSGLQDQMIVDLRKRERFVAVREFQSVITVFQIIAYQHDLSELTDADLIGYLGISKRETAGKAETQRADRQHAGDDHQSGQVSNQVQ